MKLKNIFESKDEQAEMSVAGKSIKELAQAQFPPCVAERGTFMADFAFSRIHEHPYAKRNMESHSHFKATPIHYPAFGAAAVPYRWLMRKFVLGDPDNKVVGLIDQFPVDDVSLDHEPPKDVLGFDTNWLQDQHNHHTLLDCFWNHIRPEESLVFFYAKQVPLVEDTGRRVIVGVGRVKSIGDLTEYEYHGSPNGKLRSLIWERMVVHSIRPDLVDGFLLPYHEAMEKSDDGRAFDPAEVVAFAPKDRFVEFSYATEHVSHDAAISALLSCRSALLRAAERFNFQTSRQESWIDRELGRLWKKRGPFPGLGSVLSASGIPMGNFIAQTLADKVGEEGNAWSALDSTLQDPEKHLPKELARHIDDTVAKAWKRLAKDRRSFLELLSRIDLTLEQAGTIISPEVRTEELGIDLPDSKFLENPYLIYEATRLTATPIAIATVDRGLFPTNLIRERFPIPKPTLVKTAVDARRLRALTIQELESAAGDGDTLRARDDVITELRRGENDRREEPTGVTADLLAVAEEEQFAGEVRLVRMSNDRVAYQLERFAAVGELIRSTVERRVKAQRHSFEANWRADLDLRLGQLPENGEEREQEERARQEKAAALAEIAASRFSVLIGSAGTGKTTLLSVLCRHGEIHDGGILLLAPTGKARVRMESLAIQAGVKNYSAFTLAQFLCPYNGVRRYDPATGRYFLAGEPGDKVARTVIVDECSMLTEEMMAALLEAISGVHRLIFVGDPRQLPPIGAGRPFVDIIAQLSPADVETRFPRVAAGFAELTVPRRQGAGERDDLQLAAWFGGAATAPGEDEVFEILAGRRTSDHICFIHWETPDELEAALPQTIAETLKFNTNQEEWQSFAQSLGAQLDKNGSAWFNAAFGDRTSSGKSAEAWQILTPVNQKPWGVDPLNRLIHVRYKRQEIEIARSPGKYRNTPAPMGESQIVYGDKVINGRNWSVPLSRVFPKPTKRRYLANGEIGVVVGHRRTMKKSWFPDALEVEFSTQTGQVFKFYNSDFGEEGVANLDLAYALSIHKSQGSEFNVVFLVLPRSPLMMTRELLYTALTRQKEKVVVLHQGSATELQKLSSEQFSTIANRLTNLFAPPKPVKVGESFLEDRLIHRTARGEAVRSKSEVIIADHLYANKINYHYEHPLEIDGVIKYPDFTIEDDDTGITYFWEHCGMLSDPAYRKRWRSKQDWYRKHKILPYQEGPEEHGTKGTLIVTEDTPQGGISSQEILRIIRTVILKLDAEN